MVQSAFRIRFLSAADKLYDFNPCPFAQHRLAPQRLLHDASIHFHGDAFRIEVQPVQEIENSFAVAQGPCLAIHNNLELHGWLTPLFCTNYSQIWAPSSLNSMPNSYAEQYFPVLLQAVIAMALAAGLLTVSFLLGKRVRNRVKDMPYESGIVPTGDARQRFSVKFYLVAMLFILFDIEAIFLYPWAVVFRDLKMAAFLEMLVFVVLILSGFFYIWKKGALDWSGSDLSSRKR